MTAIAAAPSGVLNFATSLPVPVRAMSSKASSGAGSVASTLSVALGIPASAVLIAVGSGAVVSAARSTAQAEIRNARAVIEMTCFMRPSLAGPGHCHVSDVRHE
jgi:hypothetical protein